MALPSSYHEAISASRRAGHNTTAADYTPDQAGHYDNAPAELELADQELDAIPDELELEESGQLSIGVEGEQRALPMLAPQGKPAPVAPDAVLEAIRRESHTRVRPWTLEELETLRAAHAGELVKEA